MEETDYDRAESLCLDAVYRTTLSCCKRHSCLQIRRLLWNEPAGYRQKRILQQPLLEQPDTVSRHGLIPL